MGSDLFLGAGWGEVGPWARSTHTSTSKEGAPWALRRVSRDP